MLPPTLRLGLYSNDISPEKLPLASSFKKQHSYQTLLEILLALFFFRTFITT